MNLKDIQIKDISKSMAFGMVVENHYSKHLPALNKIFLGGYLDGRLIGAMTLGYGTRPQHTIKKLFPQLSTADYLENGRMVVIDDVEKPAETIFISKCMAHIKQYYPQYKLIYTWSDGMLGKPGYVYQAANFLYGGYIWTDTYITDKGEKVHPRQTNKIGGRPSKKDLLDLGWTHYMGKQFRYLLPLVKNTKRRNLLASSTVNWSQNYPKHSDLQWKKYDHDKGKWIFCDQPKYDSSNLDYNEKHKHKMNLHLNSTWTEDKMREWL